MTKITVGSPPSTTAIRTKPIQHHEPPRNGNGSWNVHQAQSWVSFSFAIQAAGAVPLRRVGSVRVAKLLNAASRGARGGARRDRHEVPFATLPLDGLRHPRHGSLELAEPFQRGPRRREQPQRVRLRPRVAPRVERPRHARAWRVRQLGARRSASVVSSSAEGATRPRPLPTAPLRLPALDAPAVHGAGAPARPSAALAGARLRSLARAACPFRPPSC
jgi:hypothetical protein